MKLNATKSCSLFTFGEFSRENLETFELDGDPNGEFKF